MTKNSPLKPKKENDHVSLKLICFLTFLSIDNAFLHYFPSWLSGAPPFLIIVFIFFQSIRAYHITRIPELIAASTAIFIVFFQIPSTSSSGVGAIPTDSLIHSVLKIISILFVISLMLPWNWLSYQMIQSRTLRVILLSSTTIFYPIILVSQFSDRWAGSSYIFSIIFFSTWLLIATLQIKLFYHSDRNKRGKELVILLSLILLIPLILLISVPTKFTSSLAHLGMDMWLIFVYFTVTSYPHAFMLTQRQTIRAAGAFYDIKAAHETIVCGIYDNVDQYLRNIPEESVMNVDNDKLTLMWIGLQRTDNFN